MKLWDKRTNYNSVELMDIAQSNYYSLTIEGKWVDKDPLEAKKFVNRQRSGWLTRSTPVVSYDGGSRFLKREDWFG